MFLIKDDSCDVGKRNFQCTKIVDSRGFAQDHTGKIKTLMLPSTTLLNLTGIEIWFALIFGKFLDPLGKRYIHEIKYLGVVFSQASYVNLNLHSIKIKFLYS